MELLEFASEFESRLGIRPGFFNELIRESDWSFVIQLHAFFEACLTHAICLSIGRPELESVISRLDTLNGQYGKMAFVKQLNILDKPQRRFIATLSELRNSLVHNVRNVDFNFREYIDSLPDEERYRFCVSLSLDEVFEPIADPGEIRIISFVHDVPKYGIAEAALIVLADLYLQVASGELKANCTKIGEMIVDKAMKAKGLGKYEDLTSRNYEQE